MRRSSVRILPRFVKKKNKPNKLAICDMNNAINGFDVKIFFHGIDPNDIERFFPVLPVSLQI